MARKIAVALTWQVLAVTTVLVAPSLAFASPEAASVRALTGLNPSEVVAKSVCPPAAPGTFSCTEQVLVNKRTGALARPPESSAPAPRPMTAAPMSSQLRPAIVPPGVKAPRAGTPQYLQQAYDLVALSASNGGGDTVAIVNFYGYAAAESDLNEDRKEFGLPECTTGNGCFRKVNQKGEQANYPAEEGGEHDSEAESALDMDAVSAFCPNCKILVVEATNSSSNNVEAAQKEAALFGPNQISDSFGQDAFAEPESSYVFPHIATVTSTGDFGYTGHAQYPASLPGVTAVGGTSILRASEEPRGFSEEAWSGTGSGCAAGVTKPTWQHDSGCTGRSYNDISADADPNSGLAVYDSLEGGWFTAGGTSLAAPLTAAYYALLGGEAGVSGGKWASEHASLLTDVVSGSNDEHVTCPTGFTYICVAGPGYDGPTGFGSISGNVIAGAPGIGYGGQGTVIGESTENFELKEFGATTARLGGGVYPNHEETATWWEYGPTTTYGQSTTKTSVPSSTSLAEVEANLSSLAIGQTYHFRLVAENSLGTTYGSDYEFTTGGQPTVSELTVTLAEASDHLEFTGTGEFTLNPNGPATHYWIEYGTSLAYGEITSGGEVSGGTPQVIIQSMPKLQPNKKYYYRVDVQRFFANIMKTGSFETGAVTGGSPPVVIAPPSPASIIPIAPVFEPVITPPPPPTTHKIETTAQKLAKALKVCHKLKPKSKRVACEKKAKKKYAPPKKKKK